MKIMLKGPWTRRRRPKKGLGNVSNRDDPNLKMIFLLDDLCTKSILSSLHLFVRGCACMSSQRLKRKRKKGGERERERERDPEHKTKEVNQIAAAFVVFGRRRGTNETFSIVPALFVFSSHIITL